MADIKVRIEVNPNAESEVLGDIINGTNELSNVSLKTNENNIFQNIPTSEQKGINGLSFAQDLVFNNNDYLDNADMNDGVIEDEKNPIEFIWGVVPSSGKYSVKFTFTNAQNLKNIIINGDKVVNQFPTRAIIDDKIEIYSDDIHWAINLQGEGSTHTIEFTDWNRTNYNACLTSVLVMLRYYDVTKTNGLKSVESLAQSTGQPKDIFYGVVPNNGSIEIVDVDGEIAEMINDKVIKNSNVKFELFANNKKVQSHISTDSDYNNNSQILSVDLSNDITDLDKLVFDGNEYGENMTAYKLMSKVLAGLGKTEVEIDNMLASQMIYGDNLTGTVKEYLSKIILPSSYLERATYRETLDKFCTLAQLNMLCDNNGKFKFISARPIEPKAKLNNVIKITPSQIIGKTQNTIITKNNYDGIDISVARINVTENIGDVAYETTIVDLDNNLTTTQSDNGEEAVHSNGGGYDFVYAIMKSTFININLSIPRFTNNRLKEITNLYDGISVDEYDNQSQNINYEVQYTKKTGNSSTYATQRNMFEHTAVVNTNYTNEKEYSGTFDNSGITHSYGKATITVQSDDISNIKQSGLISSNNNGYELSNLKVLIKKELIGLGAQGTIKNFNDEPMNWAGDCTLYTASKLRLSINGDIKEISFDYIDANSPNLENATTIASIPQSEILQENAMIDNVKMSTIIKNNIFADYKNGINTLNLTCVCGDYYSINGNKMKNWSIGDIFEVGDIVRVDKDNNGNSAWKYQNKSPMYWKVVSREFKYTGVPLLDLQLQQCIINS